MGIMHDIKVRDRVNSLFNLEKWGAAGEGEGYHGYPAKVGEDGYSTTLISDFKIEQANAFNNDDGTKALKFKLRCVEPGNPANGDTAKFTFYFDGEAMDKGTDKRAIKKAANLIKAMQALEILPADFDAENWVAAVDAIYGEWSKLGGRVIYAGIYAGVFMSIDGPIPYNSVSWVDKSDIDTGPVAASDDSEEMPF